MFGALPVPTRLGRFASADQLAQWMQENHVATVLDASHAFDSDVSKMAGAVCTRLALKYVRVLRPPWRESALDRWQHVASIQQAVRIMPDKARVFANTGWNTLPEYADFPGDKLFMRQTHPVRDVAPFHFVQFVSDRPPFSQFREEETFSRLRITHLICRNVGGAASMSKLLAARQMSLPVFMIRRSPLPAHLPVVETVAEALAWEADA